MNYDLSDELVACLVDYILGIYVGWTWIIMQACEYDIWSMMQVEYMWIMKYVSFSSIKEAWTL